MERATIDLLVKVVEAWPISLCYYAIDKDEYKFKSQLREIMSRILVTGASGFIGSSLIDFLLSAGHEVVAFSRSGTVLKHERLIVKKGDLFSLKDIANAMEGCDQAVYLVHSMLPTAGLDQGHFEDFDLILADNFARAAKALQIKHVLYLGGLIPEEKKLSTHLQSRLEVEQVLKQHLQNVTILRAGIILGAAGSSAQIMLKLVKRLPLMICPAWTHTKTQPIDLEDLIKILARCLEDHELQNQTYDVGGPSVLSYLDMMKKLAKTLGSTTLFVSVPWFSVRLSRLWVSVVTQTPRELVYPLVLSLKYKMQVHPERAFPISSLRQTDVSASFKKWALHTEAKVKRKYKSIQNVRSIQRLTFPAGKTAEWVAREYFLWLPRFFSFLIKIELEGNRCKFYFLTPKISLLVLEKSEERSSSDRQLLYIKGGLLAGEQDRGRLEFREVLNGKYIMAGIHDFKPGLPWPIYRWTQYIVHFIVMWAFEKHLQAIK